MLIFRLSNNAVLHTAALGSLSLGPSIAIEDKMLAISFLPASIFFNAMVSKLPPSPIFFLVRLGKNI